MAEAALGIVIIVVIVWWADRASIVERIERLETAVNEVRTRLTRLQANLAAGAAAGVTSPARQESTQLAQPVSTTAVPPRTAPGPDIGQSPAQTPSRAAMEPAATQGASLLSEFRTASPAPAAAALPGGRAASDLAHWATRFLTDGNLIVRVGILVLFFGVAFLLRYAAEHSHLPIETRLTGVALAAVALLILGWRWRKTRRGYALALQGGGVGVLYLTVFAALRMYGVLSPGAAFALLAVVAALSAALAVLQDSLAFAMLSAAGGYLAPVLAATPHGDHVALFSYFALLNLAVVVIAWFRSWRPLNLLAFAFTYGIGAIWGVLRYTPDNFATTEPFVIIFFAMFVAIAVLFALRRAPDFSYYVDGTLVFGVPVITLGIQAGLVRHMPYGLAYSSLVLSATYLALAWTLHRLKRADLRLLVEAFLALGVAFATLAIPFAFEGRWTAAAWALEGAAALWVGLRQNRRLAVAAGLSLQLMAGVAYFVESHEAGTGAFDVFLVDSRYIAAVLVSAGGLFCAARLRMKGPAWLEAWRGAACVAMFVWGLLWWLAAGFLEIQKHVHANFMFSAQIAFLSITAVLAGTLGRRLNWALPRIAALLLTPALYIIAAAGYHLSHPLQYGGWWAWPVAITAMYLVLWSDETSVGEQAQTLLHTLALWLGTWVVTAESAWQLARAIGPDTAWSACMWGLVPACALILAARGGERWPWPFTKHWWAYAVFGAGGLGVYLCIWGLDADLRSDGTATPLPYVPLLNPMDSSQAFSLIALVLAVRSLLDTRLAAIRADTRAMVYGVVGLSAFFWATAVLLRVLHHYAAVPYDLASMTASTLAQTSLTIFWTVLALAGMSWASRSGRRIAWIAGAALLTVVIVKLFLVDLSRTGTIPRIVSFLGVGILMLIIGYVSPLPPRDANAVR